jgi:hypothetical protein
MEGQMHNIYSQSIEKYTLLKVEIPRPTKEHILQVISSIFD